MKSLIVLLLMLIFAFLPHQLVAQIPRTLSYQGVLSDTSGVPKPDGSYTLTFRLYAVSIGGSAIWTETKTLQTKRGLFHTILADQIPFDSSVTFNRPYWLGIQVQGEPQELSPRAPLTSVAYSLNSLRIENLRIIRGTVLGIGSSSGDGWTASYLGNGRYLVQFTQAFSSVPTVTLAIHADEQYTHIISINDAAGGVTLTGFSTYLSDGPGVVNFAKTWDFIAIGQ